MKEQQKILLTKFKSELLKWNKKINLISRSSEDEIDKIHIQDAIIGSSLIIDDLEKNKIVKKNIFDLGAGNGIPGLIFSILYPNYIITSVDSDDRKSAFMRTAGLSLGLSNYRVINDRVENLILDKYIFIARGFAPIEQSFEFITKVSEKGTIFYHFKTENWQNELSKSCSTWNISQIGEYVLETNPIQKRCIVKSEKIF